MIAGFGGLAASTMPWRSVITTRLPCGKGASTTALDISLRSTPTAAMAVTFPSLSITGIAKVTSGFPVVRLIT